MSNRQNSENAESPSVGLSDLLAAPCLFCGYNGQGYYQAGIHKKNVRGIKLVMRMNVKRQYQNWFIWRWSRFLAANG